MAQALLAGADVLKCIHTYKSAFAICWENIILHSHPKIEISFKFIPKILMSKECIHFWGHSVYSEHGESFWNQNYRPFTSFLTKE